MAGNDNLVGDARANNNALSEMQIVDMQRLDLIPMMGITVSHIGKLRLYLHQIDGMGACRWVLGVATNVKFFCHNGNLLNATSWTLGVWY